MALSRYYVLVERGPGQTATFRQEAKSLREAIEMSEAEHLALFKIEGQAVLAGRHEE